MNYCCGAMTDMGPNPYVANVKNEAVENQFFRTAVWTGEYLQMTLMSIPPCGEIGLEVHSDTDQLIRVERGNAIVIIGKCRNQYDIKQNMCEGDAVFVPAGAWHNIINTGRNSLKISSIYAPPNHLRGTIHRTKADAEREEA